MNLIDQLGGYKGAKDALEDAIENGFYSIESIGSLQAELLKYRREHNIYEVGDKVVLTNISDDDVFEYVEYSKGLDLHFFESKYNYGHAKLSDIRHATDKEIKAGKRL